MRRMTSPAALVHGFDRIPVWSDARARAGRFLLALDFDGTLAPIVPRPDDAMLPAPTRAAIEAVLARGDTRVAIVSGRGLADARERVGIAGIYYAGNHGMEIDGPGIHHVHPDAAAARPQVAACAEALRRRLASLDGVQVEDKGLTLSVHYRRARDPEAPAAVRQAIDSLCAGDDRLRVTEGKMIFEVRPAVDWDKGRATRFLLDALVDHDSVVPAVFVGDDRTDEDAFRALREDADRVLRDAVVVAPESGDTHATCYVRSPAEVAELIGRLA
ncbi:MAG: trehalose-phosphatase [Longimicrobiales bacterium]